MIVTSSADGQLGLRDPQDFRRFHVEVAAPAASLEILRAALAGRVEFVDAETAWVATGAVERLAADDPAWRQDFQAMIAKARPHGWIDDARGAIRAHVVWQG